MDLGHSCNRDFEQNQSQQQEISYEQRVGQFYNDTDVQSGKNSEVAQVLNRYSGPEQLELKNQIAHATASTARSLDPHIASMFVSNDNRHIVGWINEHFMFKVPFPKHSRKEEQPQLIQQRVEKVEIGSRKYEMTVTIASMEAIAPFIGETGSHPATPSGIMQEKNLIGKSDDWLEENLTSPVRNGYEEYVKRPLADALKIETDDSETTRAFKQGATTVGGTALGVMESVGEGIARAGNLAKEGVSLAYDKVSFFAYEHLDIDIGIGSEDDARMVRERSDA